MQKGGGCKTDWRWEGKCSSPGGCCKGGRKRRTRRRRRRKKGRGKKHKSSPTSRDKYSGPERRTLTEKKHKTLLITGKSLPPEILTKTILQQNFYEKLFYFYY